MSIQFLRASLLLTSFLSTLAVFYPSPSEAGCCFSTPKEEEGGGSGQESQSTTTMRQPLLSVPPPKSTTSGVDAGTEDSQRRTAVEHGTPAPRGGNDSEDESASPVGALQNTAAALQGLQAQKRRAKEVLDQQQLAQEKRELEALQGQVRAGRSQEFLALLKGVGISIYDASTSGGYNVLTERRTNHGTDVVVEQYEDGFPKVILGAGAKPVESIRGGEISVVGTGSGEAVIGKTKWQEISGSENLNDLTLRLFLATDKRQPEQVVLFKGSRLDDAFSEEDCRAIAAIFTKIAAKIASGTGHKFESIASRWSGGRETVALRTAPRTVGDLERKERSYLWVQLLRRPGIRGDDAKSARSSRSRDSAQSSNAAVENRPPATIYERNRSNGQGELVPMEELMQGGIPSIKEQQSPGLPPPIPRLTAKRLAQFKDHQDQVGKSGGGAPVEKE